MKSKVSLLRESPFFESFDEADVRALARHARLQRFGAGEVIFNEGDRANHFYLLVSGQVRLSFSPRGVDQTSSDTQLGGEVLVRTLEEPGRAVGWSCVVEPFRYRANAVTVTATRMLAFDRGFLEHHCDAHPEFGARFMRQILLLLGNRLRASRIRLISSRYEHEILAIRGLLDQGAELLHVTSPLHRIPHYLENRLTLADAFQVLETVRRQGDDHERTMAGLCLEVLQGVRKELRLYQRLQHIYEVVASAPRDQDPVKTRELCCQGFIDLFDDVDYVVHGEHHLPEAPGHIFILNHLINHPENTLPNAFQLTLDTHFVSAVLLYRKYRQAPIRVIRRSRTDEYGHQRYYDQLGYIYVDRAHVEESQDVELAASEVRRATFLDAASQALRSGVNLVICPEGTSTRTELSPLVFRSGAFRLAAYAEPEPLIVPIAIANFDKKLTRTRVSTVVHEPFRLSDRLGRRPTDQALSAFLREFHAEYTSWVRDAVDAARTAASPRRHPDL